MAVLAINGSPRPKGNTRIMLDWVGEGLRQEGIETEVFQIGGEHVSGCKACGSCGRTESLSCVQNDLINTLIPKMVEADAIILGSPVYFADITPELKCVIDRVGYVCLHQGNPLRRKPGAAVVVARRAGHVHAFDSINHFFGILQMYTVGSRYWNLGVAREAGNILDDREALETMQVLAGNLAWLIKKLKK
ncbi:MAG: flavodoxin family protein [Deltaproteobacteria bacterium]|nr:flavodoxin family protein [Deltaproteobacteria bacterium]